jgi:hypothetical protein
MHLDPLPDHPISSIGCIKIKRDGWEAMVWVFCELVVWIMARRWDMASRIFHGPEHKNHQPAATHHALRSIFLFSFQNGSILNYYLFSLLDSINKLINPNQISAIISSQ